MVLNLCITFLLPESYQINNLLTLLASVRLVAAALSCSLRCGGGAFSEGEGEKRAGPHGMEGRAIKEWNSALNKSF